MATCLEGIAAQLLAGSGRARAVAARLSRPDFFRRRLRRLQLSPYAEYVARHGYTAEDLEFSLATLREITTRFSAEPADRPFLDIYRDHKLATLPSEPGQALPRTSVVRRGHRDPRGHSA
jgi:hypothetical protein